MSAADLAKARPTAVETASLWDRTRAIVVDLIIISILQSVINGVFGSEHVTSGVIDPSVNGGFASYTSSTTVDGFWLWAAALAYFTLLEGLFGMTVGKAVVGLRVTDLNGRRAGWRAALVRNVFRVVDSLPGIYLVGVLVARFSPLHQRIGDRVAGTLVVPIRAAVGPPLTDEQRRRRLGVVLGVLGLFTTCCAVFVYLGRPPIVLDTMARLGQFPGGRVATYRHGTAQWNGGSVTYPVTYTLAGSGKTCNATITLDWTGFPQGWVMRSGESQC